MSLLLTTRSMDDWMYSTKKSRVNKIWSIKLFGKLGETIFYRQSPSVGDTKWYLSRMKIKHVNNNSSFNCRIGLAGRRDMMRMGSTDACGLFTLGSCGKSSIPAMKFGIVCVKGNINVASSKRTWQSIICLDSSNNISMWKIALKV